MTYFIIPKCFEYVHMYSKIHTETLFANFVKMLLVLFSKMILSLCDFFLVIVALFIKLV